LEEGVGESDANVSCYMYLGFIRGRVGVEGDLLTVVVLANSALVGIVISLTPLSCDLMGLFGAGGNGAAGV